MKKKTQEHGVFPIPASVVIGFPSPCPHGEYWFHTGILPVS